MNLLKGQEPKLELPTIYKAYVRGYVRHMFQKIWLHICYTYVYMVQYPLVNKH